MFERGYIVLKHIVLAMTISVAIITPAQAIDINIPGADRTIPVEAYKNYNYTNESLEKALSDKEEHVAKKLKSYHYRDYEISKKVQYSKNSLRAMHAHSTIIRLHSDTDSMRLVMPFSSQHGMYTQKQDGQTLEINNQKIDFSIMTDTTQHLNKLNKKNHDLHRDIKKFAYPSIGSALWFKEKQQSKDNNEIYTTGIQFKNPKNKLKSYRMAFTYNGDGSEGALIDRHVENMIANYIVPSIQILPDTDSYSESKELYGFVYKTPKGLEQKIGYDINNDANHVYKTAGYEQSVDVSSTIRGDESMAAQYTKMLEFITIIGINLGIKDSQYAIVWNDGIPSALIDVYNPDGESLIVVFTYDDNNRMLTNWIAYNLKESKLSHDEIRNIAESVKIKDKVSLTNQKIQPLSEEFLMI